MNSNDQSEDWGKTLSRYITASEARVKSYKILVGQAYKNKDDGLKTLFKALRQAEEKWLKALRQEKTDLNAGVWLHPSHKIDYDSMMESEDKISEILESL